MTPTIGCIMHTCQYACYRLHSSLLEYLPAPILHIPTVEACLCIYGVQAILGECMLTCMPDYEITLTIMAAQMHTYILYICTSTCIRLYTKMLTLETFQIFFLCICTWTVILRIDRLMCWAANSEL
jgi:hypothetical protein